MTALDERPRAFREFDVAVFNILRLALAYDMTPENFRQVEKDIALSILPAARKQMMMYTDKIDIYVSGSQWKYGWWWDRKIHKHITADITFNPYKASLSAWLDPTAPDGIRCFQ